MTRTHRKPQAEPSNNRTAVAAFVSRKARIDTLLEMLSCRSDEHFNVSPEAVHWGHVGNLDLWLEHLEQIASFEGLTTHAGGADPG